MIDLYMIRHGEATTNLDLSRYAGRSVGAELTPKGMKQSEELGRQLAKIGLRPHVVFTSPAVRARQTAQYALATAGYNFFPLMDDRLHEVSQGDWEGLKRVDCRTAAEEARAERERDNFCAPNGESLNHVKARIHRFLGDLTTSYEEPTTVFAFGHGFTTRSMYGAMMGWDHAQISDHGTPNTSLTHVIFDGDKWQPQFVGKMANELEVIVTNALQ